MAANLAPFLSSFLRLLPSDAPAAAAANTVVHNSAGWCRPRSVGQVPLGGGGGGDVA